METLTLPPIDNLNRDQLFALIVNASARLATSGDGVPALPLAPTAQSSAGALGNKKGSLGNTADAAPVAHLTARQVATRLQISAPTLWRMRKRPGFPQAVLVGKRAPRWREADISRWERGGQGR
jgi:predicted DNA-binding transcriptional regulator AlpA